MVDLFFAEKKNHIKFNKIEEHDDTDARVI